MQTSKKQVKKKLQINDSFFNQKYKYLLLVKSKANLYYKKLLCYLSSYINPQFYYPDFKLAYLFYQ